MERNFLQERDQIIDFVSDQNESGLDSFLCPDTNIRFE
jgi:CRISPR/Cas system-associated exonuclease Cas4 (RecB family)